MGFQASLASVCELLFRNKLSADLILLEEKALLDIADVATSFSTTIFSHSDGANSAQLSRERFLHWQSSRFRKHQAPTATSDGWKHLPYLDTLWLLLSDIHSCSSLSIGECLPYAAMALLS